MITEYFYQQMQLALLDLWRGPGRTYDVWVFGAANPRLAESRWFS